MINIAANIWRSRVSNRIRNSKRLNSTSRRTIADQWSVSKTALIRHREHAAATLEKAVERHEEARGDRLLSQMHDLQARTMRLLAQAETDGDRRTLVAAIREARANTELIGRFLGQLSSSEVNVNLMAVTVDDSMAARLAETYLNRHRERVLEHNGANSDST